MITLNQAIYMSPYINNRYGSLALKQKQKVKGALSAKIVNFCYP